MTERSPEALSGQTSIAVWSLLSPSVQVWVWQLLQPQRVHFHATSLSLSRPPFLPSDPLSVEKTRRAEIIFFVCDYAWSSLPSPSLCVKYTSQGSHPRGRPNTEEWFRRLCTPIAHFPLLFLLLQVEGRRLRGEEEEPVEGSVAFPSLTSSPEPPTSVTHVKDSAATRLQWINWMDLKLMMFNPDTLQCFSTRSVRFGVFHMSMWEKAHR